MVNFVDALLEPDALFSMCVYFMVGAISIRVPIVTSLFISLLSTANNHHSEWDYRNDDENGIELVSCTSTGKLKLMHRRTFYSRAHRTESNPDPCFVSADSEGFTLQVQRKVLPAFPNSQHRSICNTTNRNECTDRHICTKTSLEFSAMLDSSTPLFYSYHHRHKTMTGSQEDKEYIPCSNEDSDRLYTEFQKQVVRRS